MNDDNPNKKYNTNHITHKEMVTVIATTSNLFSFLLTDLTALFTFLDKRFLPDPSLSFNNLHLNVSLFLILTRASSAFVALSALGGSDPRGRASDRGKRSDKRLATRPSTLELESRSRLP